MPWKRLQAFRLQSTLLLHLKARSTWVPAASAAVRHSKRVLVSFLFCFFLVKTLITDNNDNDDHDNSDNDNNANNNYHDTVAMTTIPITMTIRMTMMTIAIPAGRCCRRGRDCDNNDQQQQNSQ